MQNAGNILILIILLIATGCIQQNTSSIETMVLKEKWSIISSEKTDQTGKEISNPNNTNTDWLSVTIPATVLSGLIQNGIYKDIYFSNNLEKIDTKQFDCSWWYKTEFNFSKAKDQFQELIFEGLNYKAKIWLNGQKIADTTNVEGVFAIWKFDISKEIRDGKNTLAVEIFPPENDDLTIGFVDWNPAAPDDNMGIWRPVKIRNHGKVSINEPFVQSKVNTETLNTASLTVSTQITNHTNKNQSANIELEIYGSTIAKSIQLKANESRKIEFTPHEFSKLKIENPKLWWPNHMGKPNLHTAKTTVIVNKQKTDERTVRYGIRQIEEYWSENKYKGYKINGKKTLIKGAGWVDDLLLADTNDKVAAQVEYVKQMNMNTIRLEGFWGNNKTIYEKADELGLLIMIGWSCHWEWEGYCHRYDDDFLAIRTPEEQEQHARAYQNQVEWLRNHPSVFLWVYGSDKLPRPGLEEKLNTYLAESDPTRPILTSCKDLDFGTTIDKDGNISGFANISKISGSPGVKMRGPYAYTAPIYWYTDTVSGGAFGFNTETGPGAQVPPLESLKKMIPADKLWPMSDIWEYHNGRNEFATLKRDLEAFNARYGEADNVEDFAFKMQIHNYEAIRAMFEAFEVNKHKTTGLIQWMLNSAWPETFWQLYDWYLHPNGAFYGTQTANQPVNAIYNYADKNIYLSNSTLQNEDDLMVKIQVWDIESNLMLDQLINVEIAANTSKLVFEMPALNNISSTYFLNLEITKGTENIAKNFYWLSTKPDVIDFENSEWFYSPYKSHANFKALHNLPKVNVDAEFTKEKDNAGNTIVTCTLTNTSNRIAFFNEVSILDEATGATILPVFWDDNYVSLLPNEKRTLNARLYDRHVKDKKLKYRVTTFNGND